MFPALQDLFSYWVPPTERTRMVTAAFSGNPIGTFTTMLTSGLLAQHWGWRSIFYIYGDAYPPHPHPDELLNQLALIQVALPWFGPPSGSVCSATYAVIACAVLGFSASPKILPRTDQLQTRKPSTSL